MKARLQHRELSVPYSLQIVCGFFNIPQLFYDKSCETGPPGYSPYPRRLESLTISESDVITKGALSTQLFLRS